MSFISVHVGAGFHKSEEKYSKCLTESIEAGNQVLHDGGLALDAVVKALEILENDGVTNCGKGSSLNLNCEVQCDASLMQSSDLNWAGIGGVSGIKNPILGAKSLLLSQQKKHPDNLINPCLLVGEGARKWSIEHGCLESNNLVTDQVLDLFEKHKFEITKLKDDAISSTINQQFKPIKKRKLEESVSSSILFEHGYSESSILAQPSKDNQYPEKMLDTVGAIAIDKFGNVASAVSSGGIMFKGIDSASDEGRIGQAAVYGAGCFVDYLQKEGYKVAVTTTGVGEYLIKTIFAKKCASKLLKASKQIDSDKFDGYQFDDVIKNAFINNFLNSKYLTSVDHDKLIGVLSLVARPEDRKVQLIWAHNTKSFFIGYKTNPNDKPEYIFSRTLKSDKNFVEAKSLLINY